MLIKFAVSNFLSFKEETTFDMVASNERIHPHHVVRTKSRNQPNLLRMGVVYGANAAGKSNLVKALKFVKNLVVEGRSPEARIPVQRFRLDPSCLREPARFRIEFRINDANYAYSFAIDQQRIHVEELRTITNTSDSLLYARTTSSDGEVQVRFGSFHTRLNERDRLFLEFIARGTRPNQLFLHETIERNEKRFHPAYHWFQRVLTIIEPATDYPQLAERLGEDDDCRDFLCKVLQTAGTGISAIETEEQTLDTLRELPPEILDFAQEQLADNTSMFFRAPDGERFSIVKRGDEFRVLRLKTVHGGVGATAVSFDLHEESDGTQRLFDLVPVLHNLTSGTRERVVFVDEIGRSLHPHLTNMIVGMHLDPANANKSSQLLITTHETNLLDLDILRRDEIWFAEKRRDGSTDLYSLSDFQPRYDKDIRRDYLVGRYGAIPYIGDVASLQLPEENEHVPDEREPEPVDAA